MSSKHVYSSPEGLVVKSLQGAVALNPSLRLHEPSKTVYISPPSSQTRVSVISGGGAAHEPAHASYTGYGMLAASVSGEIFASPSAKQIICAIRLSSYPGEAMHVRRTTITQLSVVDDSKSSSLRTVPSRKDVLVIINNYTGDRLNFGLAIEKARAEGITVESVIVADDVSLLHSDSESSSLVGPRGLAGNILVCKILGALAERGSSLENLKQVGDTIVAHLASIGVGLEHCHVPGTITRSNLGNDECEVGLGLHNEQGVRRVKMSSWGLDSAAVKLVDEMVGKVLRSRGVVDGGRDNFISEGDNTVLFVNNLGGMSQLEMGALITDILARLALSDIHPVRIYCSSYMTSLNAPGFSLSLLNVSTIHRVLRFASSALVRQVDILQLLDDPTEAHSWVGVRRFWHSDGQRDLREHEQGAEKILRSMTSQPHDFERTSKVQDEDGLTDPPATAYWQQADISPERVEYGIIGACRALLAEESVLTEYDTIVGDGDCGTTFARGAKAILSAIEKHLIEVSKLSPDQVVGRIGDVFEDNMGGTIGALFAIFFTAWSSAIKFRMINPSSSSSSPSSPTSSPAHNVQFMETLSDALASLSHHTPAKPGDRTLMDALYPLCNPSLGAGKARGAVVEVEAGSVDGRVITVADTGNPAASTSNVDSNTPQESFAAACLRAHEGALSTRGMKPKLGRAVYVEIKEGDSELPPDPGAWGVAVLVQGFWDGFCGRVPGQDGQR